MTKRILNVDDSDCMREFINLTLSSLGYDVSNAVNGEDALDKMAEKQFQLVITDLKMPVIDGKALIVHLREMPEYLGKPILLLTADEEGKEKREAIRAGATACLNKPLDTQRLVAVVQRLVGA